MKEINFTRYKVVCITGGEPLLFPLRVVAISQLARFSKAFVVLYTNGTFLNATMADMLMRAGVQAINVGLHEPKAFGQIIRKVVLATMGTGISVRFHVCNKYKSLHLEREFPSAVFKYWEMNACDRENEERVVLKDWEDKNYAPTGLSVITKEKR
jgi:organic radical activating enzyme